MNTAIGLIETKGLVGLVEATEDKVAVPDTPLLVLNATSKYCNSMVLVISVGRAPEAGVETGMALIGGEPQHRVHTE